MESEPRIAPSLARVVALTLALGGVALPVTLWFLLRDREAPRVPRPITEHSSPPPQQQEDPARTFERDHLRALEGRTVWCARVYGRPPVTTYHEDTACPVLQAQLPIELDRVQQRMRPTAPIALQVSRDAMATAQGYGFMGYSCPKCRGTPPGAGAK